MKLQSIILLLIGMVLLTPFNAWAYIDAGTGSYILQALVAGFFGGLFIFKQYYARIKNYFSKSNSDDELDESDGIKDKLDSNE